MAPFFGTIFGNPHSRGHALGWRAAEAVDKAREQVARAVGATPSEIVFTSGATESNNLALRGIDGPVATTAIEHPSILNAVAATVVPVGADGLLDPAAIADALSDGARLVSVGLVNHEIGVIQPIAEIARVCQSRGVLLHADCAQALGKIDLDLSVLGADLASFSAHKVYGPMGIGGLFVRRGVDLSPILFGGDQEMGLRAGTVPLPLAVGFGAAAKIASEETGVDAARIAVLRDSLLARLRQSIPDLQVNGSMAARVSGNLNITVPRVDAEALMLAVPEVAVSSGSACASGSTAPSPVLRALGLDADAASRSLRICLGRFTTEEETERAGEVIAAAWQALTTQ